MNTAKSKNSELAEALELISSYYISEFGEDSENDGNSSDLSNIGLAYTTLGENDPGVEIQASVDLVNFRLFRTLGGAPLDETKYSSLRELVDEELKFLNFDELTFVSRDVLEEYEKEENKNGKYPTTACKADK